MVVAKHRAHAVCGILHLDIETVNRAARSNTWSRFNNEWVSDTLSSTVARTVITRTVVFGRSSIVIACCAVRAASNLCVVTHAVAVGIGGAVATTNAQGVELVAVSVAVTGRDVFTSAIVDRTRAVADAARVKLAHAVVHVVANAVGIFVSCAIATTHAQGVFLVAVTVAVASGDAVTATHTALIELVAVTVAVAGGDVSTSALVNRARTVADAALVHHG